MIPLNREPIGLPKRPTRQIHPRPSLSTTGGKKGAGLPLPTGGPQIHPPQRAPGAGLALPTGGPQIHPRPLLTQAGGEDIVGSRFRPRARPGRFGLGTDLPLMFEDGIHGGFRGGPNEPGDFRGGFRGGGQNRNSYLTQYGGYGDRALVVDPSNPQPLDNEIQDWRTFLEDAQDLIPEIEQSLDSTELVDRAYEDAATSVSNAKAAQELAMQRRGVRLNDAQQSYLQRAQALNAAKTTAQTVNDARLDQQQRNNEVLQNMANFAANVRGLAGDNMRAAHSLQTQRDMNNRAAREARRQELTSMATTALTAMLLGI